MNAGLDGIIKIVPGDRLTLPHPSFSICAMLVVVALLLLLLLATGALVRALSDPCVPLLRRLPANERTA